MHNARVLLPALTSATLLFVPIEGVAKAARSQGWADVPSNMQSQTKRPAKEKNRTE